MGMKDKATRIRNGESLDIAAVEAFVKNAVPGLMGEMRLLQFPRGHSNLTYLLSFENRELVLRRPPFGTKAKTAHDMNREYKILSALKPEFPYCPEPLAHTEDPSIMACPFYIMERIEGIIPRRDFPPGLDFSPKQVRQLFEGLLRVQLDLHTIDYRQIGLENFGKPVGYVKRQVDGWSRRYRAARTPDAPDCEIVMEWLHENMPPDSENPGVIHNDFKLDNVVLDPKDPLSIIGVLDWEMATVGDPLMDLGSSLGYWVEPEDPQEMQAIRFMPTTAAGAPSRRELFDLYARLSGRANDNFEFYYSFGLFRLAVIAQQIYYRYFHGQTRDDRFKMFVFAVAVLDQAAVRTIGKG